MQENKASDYLFIGRASDIKNKKARAIYRVLEVLPGFFVWSTFLLVFLLAYLKPMWLSIFILAFAFFWLLKSLYLAIHTKSAYKKTVRHEKINWTYRLKKLPASSYTAPIKDWRDIWQLIVLPMHNESYEIISASIEALFDSDWPKEKMIIVLGTEEAAGIDAFKVAEKIEQNYGNKFYKFLITKHPNNIEGELAGKGSNEAWAIKRTKEEIIDLLGIPEENILVSSFDADTVVYPRYFSCLTYHFLTTENPYRASYQPVPYFINNIWQAPAISRVSAFSSTFWHTMNQERPEKHLTFSSHSMTYKALKESGFWQTNVVSEDSRIFWQCFLYYNGDYKVESMYYPIAMDANVAHSYWRTMRNIYKQQRRWAYGAGDIPYFLYGYWQKRHEIDFKIFLRYAFYTMEGFYSWGTHALLLFILGWLPVLFGGYTFNATLFSYNLVRVVRVLLTIAVVGLFTSAYLSIILLPPRPPSYGKRKYIMMVLQWFLVPVTLIVFGSFPAIEAQTRLMFGKYMGFWVTEKYRKEI